MNAASFDGLPLSIVDSYPKIYLTAVDLNDGTEIIFSQGIVAPLNSLGCRSLWEDRAAVEEYSCKHTELTAAVAASSEFPPVFRPVPVYDGNRLLGVFVDGGVADNLAMNVPKDWQLTYTRLAVNDTILEPLQFNPSRQELNSYLCSTAASHWLSCNDVRGRVGVLLNVLLMP